MNVLDKIIHYKKKEVELNKQLYPEKLLESSIYFDSKPISLKEYLLRGDKSGIIAEFKRKSPSRGMINEYSNVEDVSISYMQSGASALSVLTDGNFFGGKNQDLTTARKFNYCPILRKDFIVDEYQVIEAKSIGADAILLIASVLDKSRIEQLSKFAKELNLEILFEVHNKEELNKLSEHIDIVGVNNRDLKSFNVDINNSIDMLKYIHEGVVKVSESGINTADDYKYLRSNGYNGFLIGERFMSSANPGLACRKFIKEVNQDEN